MQDPEEDLRATSESIQDDADQLKRLEARKTSLDPTDPLVLDLSRQIESLVQRIAEKARAERDLSEEIQGA
jgi:hypothetical protein